jgi:hypothetical protein
MTDIELHTQDRADNLLTLEQHLRAAALLSRAMWDALGSSEIDTSDSRTREGLRELASSIADHASAANFVFHTSSENQQ